MKSLNVLIVGVGGQGTLLASRVLGKYALDEGYDVKLSEVHGMAQRGGSVMTYVRIGEKIASPIIDEGQADLILAFEKLEALRYAHYLKEGGEVLYSTQEIMPMPVVTGAAQYPQGIEAKLHARASTRWDSHCRRATRRRQTPSCWARSAKSSAMSAKNSKRRSFRASRRRRSR